MTQMFFRKIALLDDPTIVDTPAVGKYFLDRVGRRDALGTVEGMRDFFSRFSAVTLVAPWSPGLSCVVGIPTEAEMKAFSELEDLGPIFDACPSNKTYQTGHYGMMRGVDFFQSVTLLGHVVDAAQRRGQDVRERMGMFNFLGARVVYEKLRWSVFTDSRWGVQLIWTGEKGVKGRKEADYAREGIVTLTDLTTQGFIKENRGLNIENIRKSDSVVRHIGLGYDIVLNPFIHNSELGVAFGALVRTGNYIDLALIPA